MRGISFTSLAAIILAAAASAQTPATSNEQAQHHDMEARGNQGMGFAQDKTTHHFLLHKDGGAIQVTANSADDKASIEHIRMHLEHIRSAFQSGDFNIPGFVHDQTPPGVPVMIKLKQQIHYRYEEIAQGGRVTISSKNADAVAAVQEFLRFQIREHKTGDLLEPVRGPYCIDMSYGQKERCIPTTLWSESLPRSSKLNSRYICSWTIPIKLLSIPPTMIRRSEIYSEWSI